MGLPPEQLEDNDLKESMQEQNIHSVPLTPQDQQMLGMQLPATQAGAPAGSVPAGSTTVVQ